MAPAPSALLSDEVESAAPSALSEEESSLALESEFVESLAGVLDGRGAAAGAVLADFVFLEETFTASAAGWYSAGVVLEGAGDVTVASCPAVAALFRAACVTAHRAGEIRSGATAAGGIPYAERKQADKRDGGNQNEAEIRIGSGSSFRRKIIAE